MAFAEWDSNLAVAPTEYVCERSSYAQSWMHLRIRLEFSYAYWIFSPQRNCVSNCSRSAHKPARIHAPGSQGFSSSVRPSERPLSTIVVRSNAESSTTLWVVAATAANGSHQNTPSPEEIAKARIGCDTN